MNQQLKNLYWRLPFLSESMKEKFYYIAKGYIKGERGAQSSAEDIQILKRYRDQILRIPTSKDEKFYKALTDLVYERQSKDPKLIAYYLTQFHPTPENDAWWGKGVTEWDNVAHAVPQYLGHYQPRLPGELGFYDLRLKENIIRQVELAKMYGVFGFCFYYYWFDGKRLLEKPLNLFLENKDIQFPFCLCWANESWTRSFFGSSWEVIMEQKHTVESYRAFIRDVVPCLLDERYISINGRKILQIYRPENIPACDQIIKYWREYCRRQGIELYLIGCIMNEPQKDLLSQGFDAISEFQLGAVLPYCKKINSEISFVNPNFYGSIYSYADLVSNKIYEINFNKKKLYNAVMPMWDNTPRRNDKGGMIFDGANPELYKQWLKDIIRHNRKRDDLDDNLVFINAWNEWGEGAYLEPDQRYGYAYLQATLDAILESRNLE